jgi:hypothetical protein
MLIKNISSIGKNIKKLIINNTYSKLYAASDLGYLSDGLGCISVVDINQLTIIKQIIPNGIPNTYYSILANDEKHDKIYVSNLNGVGVIDIASDSWTNIENVDYPYPYLAKIGINTVTNEIYLPHLSKNRLNIINGQTLTVEKVNYPAGASQPLDIAINENINKAYITFVGVPNNEGQMGIMIFDRQQSTFKFGGQGDLEPLVFDQKGNKLYSGSQFDTKSVIIDGTTDEIAYIYHGFGGIGGIDCNENTGEVFMASTVTTIILDGRNKKILEIIPLEIVQGGQYFINVKVNQTTGKAYVINDNHLGKIMIYNK